MPAIECDGVRLHYEVSGNPRGSVLVLANSLGSNLHMWNKVLPALERSLRLLRYDMRGHGKSGLAPDAFTIEQLGLDVLRLLDEVETEQANLCGLSLGGQVGLWLGSHAPERVDRLILANTGARIGSSEMWEQRIAAAMSAGMSPLAALTIERWFTPAYRASRAQEMEEIREMIAATEPAGYAACCAVLRDADLREDARLITAPSLVIAGKYDPATPPGDGRALHAAIRNANYLELDASHLSAWERAEEFAGAVMKHLTAVEETDG